MESRPAGLHHGAGTFPRIWCRELQFNREAKAFICLRTVHMKIRI